LLTNSGSYRLPASIGKETRNERQWSHVHEYDGKLFWGQRKQIFERKETVQDHTVQDEDRGGRTENTQKLWLIMLVFWQQPRKSKSITHTKTSWNTAKSRSKEKKFKQIQIEKEGSLNVCRSLSLKQIRVSSHYRKNMHKELWSALPEISFKIQKPKIQRIRIMKIFYTIY
jgi:hypothetical protein